MRSDEFIGRFEGCHRLGPDGQIWPYVCPAGYWTQGWGRLVRQGSPPVSKEVADEWFRQDIRKHERYALHYSPILWMAAAECLVAITSFVYNLGPSRYAGSTLRKRVDGGDWEGAAEQIRRWVFGGGKKLPGLVIRRAAEAKLLMVQQ